MNYEKAIAYIEEIPKFTKKNKLSHTRECLQRLGNPDRDFDIVHVAGSNGKGSVCAFTASVLQQGGYRVGLFTSPHLIKTNERFRINGEDVSDEIFLEAFHRVYDLAQQMVREGSYHPTYFEFLFLMGMLMFSEAGVEIVILETGLGGRLDATNTVEHPLVCAITSISLEHTEYLGDTLEAVAGEKAGIIKEGAFVVYEDCSDAVSGVIKARACACGSQTAALEEEMFCMETCEEQGITFTLKDDFYKGQKIRIPFAAPYQMRNASLALLVIKALCTNYPKKYRISLETILTGMEHTRWQGRMETVLPDVIVDGAHNEDGIRRFIETAAQFQKQRRIALLFSAVADKDYEAMIKRICSSLEPEYVVTTQIDGARVVPAEKLAELFTKYGCRQVTPIERIEEAFETAYEKKGDGILFCAGSLYLIGEIKAYIRRRNTND